MVNLGEVYKGIELSLKAYGDNVEKLFCVKPGASPEFIKVQLDGSKSLRVNQDGQLVAETELGPVKFTKPIAYQEIDGKRVAVAVEYCIQGSGIEGTESRGAGEQGGRNPTYCFTVASYDRTNDLIIDPLLTSTFLGGSDGEWGNSLAIDQGGNVYVTGFEISGDFPTTAGAYDELGYGEDAFISKFNSDLTSLLASTCLGGGQRDEGYSLAIGNSGDVYVTGYTWSPGFPVTTKPDAYDIEHNGDNDVFVSILSGDLTTLIASTFLGGTSADSGECLALDAYGGVWVTGYTQSIDFPTSSLAYKTVSNGYRDVFVSHLENELRVLSASTYLGGG